MGVSSFFLLKVPIALELLKRRYLLKERGVPCGVVHFEAIMPYPIADHEIICTENFIVAAYLAKDFIRNGNRRGFVLHNDSGRKGAGIQYGITSSPHSVKCNGNFIGHKGLRVVLLSDEIMREMLPHPFLWCESHVTFPQRVIDKIFPVAFFYFY